jgi:NDP-4-keto-2,6-dideoxyhexose 3-C-methyltransferase
MRTESRLVNLPSFKLITACRGCGSGRHSNVLNLGEPYLCNFTKEKNELYPRAPLELVICNDCGLLQLKHSVSDDLLWGESYWYRSSINQTMRDALADVVHQATTFGRTEGTWLDIGANDGYLLSRVPETFRKIACEPSLTFESDLEEHADKVVMDYFSTEAVGEPANVVTSCAMFYDLDDPQSFIANVAQTLTDDGIWINQFTSAEKMIWATAFDGICHEHRTYPDLSTVQKMYARHGLSIVHVQGNEVNGGSLRITARRGGQGINLVPPMDRELIWAFADRVRRWKFKMQELLDAPGIAYNSAWGYGASTKGCYLLQYLERSERFLAIADRNPRKHGLYMTGSWLPITGEEEMRKAVPHTLLMLPWSFKTEMTDREAHIRSMGTSLLYPLPEISFVL